MKRIFLIAIILFVFFNTYSQNQSILSYLTENKSSNISEKSIIPMFFDYKIFDKESYEIINDDIMYRIRESLKDETINGRVKIAFIFETDSLGKTNVRVEDNNPEINNQGIICVIGESLKDIKLPLKYVVVPNGSKPLYVQAIYNIDLLVEEKTFKIKKKDIEIEILKESKNSSKLNLFTMHSYYYNIEKMFEMGNYKNKTYKIFIQKIMLNNKINMTCKIVNWFGKNKIV